MCSIFCSDAITIPFGRDGTKELSIARRISHIVVRESKVFVSNRKVVKLFTLKWLPKELKHSIPLYFLFPRATIFSRFFEESCKNYHTLNDAYPPFFSINYHFFHSYINLLWMTRLNFNPCVFAMIYVKFIHQYFERIIWKKIIR